MADDTKVFQEMADAMLPLFDNMPQVVVLIEDNEVFLREPFPLAVYMSPKIVINPAHARTCTFEEIQGTICHELIHAWLERKGLVGTGDHLDEHHSEWFVKKALEINKKRIGDVTVDLDFLIANPKAVDTYNRVAGIRFAPHVRHKVRRIWKSLAPLEILGVSKNDRFSKWAVVSFSVVIVILLLNRTRFIPNAVASFVCWAWAIGVFVTYAIVMLRQRTR